MTIKHLAFFSVLFSLAILVFSGCDGEDEPIPAFINVEPFTLEATDSGRHGSISEKITNARISLIDKVTNESHPIGVVTLPATFPALVTGQQQIIIDPIIKANGNSFYLRLYPFYERFTQDINLAPNEDVTVKPITTYTDDAKFSFIEDFEKPAHLFQKDIDNNASTNIEISSEDVFEGNSSGKITLDTANSFIAASTTVLYEIDPQTIGEVFMELNYKTEVPLEFGVTAVNSANEEFPVFEFAVLPKEDWNKIYFDMTDLLLTSGETKFFFILRGGIPLENGKLSLEKAHIYLDNIKLVNY